MYRKSILTAMGLRHFARAGVDVAVVEVGLGGRLDSTNVVRPAVCVITRIGLDHTDRLGKDPASIASEKAGIIKPGVPVVSASQKDEALDVLVRVADERGCDFTLVGGGGEFRPL